MTRRAPTLPPHRLEWRLQGTADWQHLRHDTPIGEAEARSQMRWRIQQGVDGLEVGRLYEARLWRHGVCGAAWVEDGRP